MRDKLKERLNHLDVDFKFIVKKKLCVFIEQIIKVSMIKLNAIVAKYEDKRKNCR